jgi:hypothetical protein
MIKLFCSYSKPLLYIILLASCGFSQKKLDCQKLRNGNFLYRSKIGNEYRSYSIKRKDSLQIEINLKTGDTSIYSVRWTGNCSYNIFFLRSTNPIKDSIRQADKNIATRTEILSATDDYYIFSGKSDNHYFTLVDTLWIER